MILPPDIELRWLVALFLVAVLLWVLGVGAW